MLINNSSLTNLLNSYFPNIRTNDDQSVKLVSKKLEWQPYRKLYNFTEGKQNLIDVLYQKP